MLPKHVISTSSKCCWHSIPARHHLRHRLHHHRPQLPAPSPAVLRQSRRQVGGNTAAILLSARRTEAAVSPTSQKRAPKLTPVLTRHLTLVQQHKTTRVSDRAPIFQPRELLPQRSALWLRAHVLIHFAYRHVARTSGQHYLANKVKISTTLSLSSLLFVPPSRASRVLYPLHSKATACSPAPPHTSCSLLMLVGIARGFSSARRSPNRSRPYWSAAPPPPPPPSSICNAYADPRNPQPLASTSISSPSAIRPGSRLSPSPIFPLHAKRLFRGRGAMRTVGGRFKNRERATVGVRSTCGGHQVFAIYSGYLVMAYAVVRPAGAPLSPTTGLLAQSNMALLTRQTISADSRMGTTAWAGPTAAQIAGSAASATAPSAASATSVENVCQYASQLQA